MKTLKRFLVLVSVLFSFDISANTKWQGSYIYEADLSGDIPDRLMFVEYVLEVSNDSCKLIIQGYQVFETILCSTGNNEKTLSIYFQSYEDGSVKNAYGIQIYTTGQRLFWLDKASITHWDALVPDESVAKPGKYFLKTAQ
ncbi:DUF5991 domain-containing protein [Cellvibrio sp.]